ncbi:MAG TPA: NAD(P)H-hydrate epimerase [Bacteroidetes bacterium]|nr:NAD(P)H-hydrate epimerase [Bacteroidota bacterium]
MHIPEVHMTDDNSLSIDKFREMDYQSVKKYNIPVGLLMENAGLNLARLTASFISRSDKILIGIGTGNNGGGGLVAARRLAGWGYKVFLHLPDKNLKVLPKQQLERALAFGAKIKSIEDPAIFVDAYLGFSQRLPLTNDLLEITGKVNKLNCKKISLDIPTGFNKDTGELVFKPDIILTLAAMKTELAPLLHQAQIFIADLGLAHTIYNEFGINPIPEFDESGIVECKQ